VVSCPEDLTFECDAVGDFGYPTASDNCGEVTIELTSRDSLPGDCPQDYTLTLNYSIADDCGNTASCTQVITVEDTTPPEIFCADQDTIECEEELIFTPPTASDNCDPSPSIVEVSVDTLEGPGDGEFTYTKTWYAVDECGNQSAECSQTIIRLACPEEFCTFTMGGWGSECPDSQVDDPFSTQPGCIRDNYFDVVFPDGVYIGDPAGNYAVWTSAAAVASYLPAEEMPGYLSNPLTNPMYTPAGVLGGQLLALKMNREFSCEGIFYDLALLDVVACFGSYVIPDSCGGPFAGMTVDQFIALADQVVAGNTGMLDPYGASLSDLNFTATCLNEFFNNCDDGDDYVIYTAPTAAKQVPDQFSLDQNRPNPFNPVTEISFALPEAANVTIEVFNIRGQKVETLINDYRDAGIHTVTWNGSNVASGVYFYRLTAGQFVETKKMMLLK
jgi:hypothetical protein